MIQNTRNEAFQLSQLFATRKHGQDKLYKKELQTSLVPRPRPAFHRLQYGKAVCMPGNEASYKLNAKPNVGAMIVTRLQLPF